MGVEAAVELPAPAGRRCSEERVVGRLVRQGRAGLDGREGRAEVLRAIAQGHEVEEGPEGRLAVARPEPGAGLEIGVGAQRHLEALGSAVGDDAVIGTEVRRDQDALIVDDGQRTGRLYVTTATELLRRLGGA